MAFDAFLKFPDIDGEATDNKHKDWIEVLSVSHGCSQAGSSQPGGRPPRVSVEDFSVGKPMDKSTPKLFEACANGKVFPKVEIHLQGAGRDRSKYMEYVLENAMVTTYSPAGNAGDCDEVPLEKVSLNFEKLSMKYTPQGEDGEPGKPVEAEFSFDKKDRA